MSDKRSVHIESALDADGAMWMAGESWIDENNPIARLAQEIDRKIDPEDYREWLGKPLPDGRTPRDCMAENDLDTLFATLDELPDREPVVIMTGHGR